MYHSLNIIGNLGKDPEMRYTPSGQAVCSFSVAASHSYNDANGSKITETTWFRVSTWGKLAENCNQYLKKGSKVFVEGRLSPDKATGSPKVYSKQDGSSGASYDVTASTVRFLSTRADADGGQAQPAPTHNIPSEDEVPF